MINLIVFKTEGVPDFVHYDLLQISATDSIGDNVNYWRSETFDPSQDVVVNGTRQVIRITFDYYQPLMSIDDCLNSAWFESETFGLHDIKAVPVKCEIPFSKSGFDDCLLIGGEALINVHRLVIESMFRSARTRVEMVAEVRIVSVTGND